MKKNIRPPQTQAPQKRKAGKKKKTWLLVLLIVLLLGVVVVAGGTYILDLVDRNPITGDPDLDESDLVNPEDTVDAPDSSGGMDQAHLEFKRVSRIKIPKDKDVYNILLIGTDARPGEGRGRSDAMIILSINDRTGTVHLTSLMRAMYVAIPGRDWSMLNHTFAWGGPELLLQTIEDNLRIKIDDYMVIRFDGFTKAIDAVGGVTIDLTAAEARVLGRSAGSNRLNGSAALNYARIRKIDSDFERTGRQRKVLEALIQESRSQSPTQLLQMAETLLPLVNTNLSNAQLLSLVTKSMGARNYPVKQLMLPLKEHREMIYVRKMEMYRFDFDKTIKTLHDFIYG